MGILKDKTTFFATHKTKSCQCAIGSSTLLLGGTILIAETMVKFMLLITLYVVT